MVRLDVAIGVGAFIISAAALSPQDQKPAFRTSIDLVHLDVSVLDGNRRPVRGLTPADFTLLDDGRPQTIEAFAAVDAPEPGPPPRAAWLRMVSPDVTTNEPSQNPEGRLFVLLLDDAMMPGDPAVTQNARKIARGVIDRLGPSDQMAVVFTLGSKNAQGFTTDRRKLTAAVDALQTGAASHLLGWDQTIPVNPRDPSSLSVPANDSDIPLRLGSLRTLQMAADTLIVAPQRRKALIYVSPGIPMDIDSHARPVKAGAGVAGLLIREANQRLVFDTTETFNRMARANVTVYSVDPCGLSGLEGYVTGRASGLSSLRSAVRPVPPDYHWLNPSVPPRPTDLAAHMARLNMDFLMAAAANTGGRAIVNTNDFEPGLNGIFEENGSYYLIGYPRPPDYAPGSLHRLQVKVNRPDVIVRTRSGYEIPATPSATPRDPIAVALAHAGAGPVADRTLPMSVAIAPLAMPGSSSADSTTVTIVLGMQEPAVQDRARQTVELQVAVYTADGIAVGAARRQQATFTRVPGTLPELRYELVTQAPVKPGRYELRIAAYRVSDGVRGSVYADVEVPDFAKAPLSLSGVWLEASPAIQTIADDAFRSLLPVVPTARRDFLRGQPVTALFRVYQGGGQRLAPVSLTVRITSDRDATLADATGTIAVDRFGPTTRMAEHRFSLPTAALESGRYLLTFEATSGKHTARRDVIFSVK